jgi:hypothetical protein
MNSTPQLSYSSIGRTADAASAQQTSKARHKHEKKIHLKPWDGLELFDRILLDARKSRESNPRAQVCLSSPRVNPAMVEKVFVEEVTTKMAKFLGSTATSLANLPAHKSILQDGLGDVNESDGSAHGETPKFVFREKKVRKVRPKPSAAFLAPRRKGPEEPSLGPPVGKYQPKFTCIERRSTTPIIPRADIANSAAARSDSPDRTPQREGQKDLTAGSDENNSSLAGTLRSGSLSQTMLPAQGAQAAPDSAPASVVPRRHGLHDTSSAFKSTVPRFSSKAALDLQYFPYTYPGQTTYSPGPFHGNARERPYTPFGKPCGAPVNYPLPDTRAKTALDFSKIVPRENLRTRLLFTPLDTSQIDHDPNISSLSTKVRPAQALPMAKQSSRPAVKTAAAAEELDPYFNSIATTKKKGFVEIRRMMYNHLAPPYTEDEAAQQALNASRAASSVDVSVVQAQAPKYSFPKGPRGNMALQGMTDLSYNADDSPVRRHRPACFMPKSERETLGRQVVNDVVYDVNESQHTVTCNIGKQISRDVRDKRFAS